MTQARRAKGFAGRGRRAWLLIVIPLLMLLAGLLLFRGISRQAEQGGLSIPGASTTSATVSPAVATPTATTPTPSPRPTPSSSKRSAQPNDAAASRALRACRAKVKAADEVLATAKTGMGHWSDHVQAQTDANSGKIKVGEMEDIFDRTMKAGDEDEKRYRSAVKSYEDGKGSCREVSGASAKIRQQLARCAQRGKAQDPVLAAADDGMEDWIKHLADMRRSEQGKIHNPQQKWLATWRAAPKNIDAYDEAADKFSAPDC
jgi:hypothetical protein